jgi:hypothetical protein
MEIPANFAGIRAEMAAPMSDFTKFLYVSMYYLYR